MDDSPFRACSDRTLLFERLKRSTRSITMLCNLEGYPIRVFTEGLPPGFSMESPPVSKKEFDIIFEYNPIRSELGVVQGNQVGRNVVLRVEYLKGDCSSFSIYLGFEPEKEPKISSTPTICSNPSNKNDNSRSKIAIATPIGNLPPIRSNPSNKNDNSRSKIAIATPIGNALPIRSNPSNKNDNSRPKIAIAPKTGSNTCNKNNEQHKHEAAHRSEDCKKPNCGTCLATAHKPRTMAAQKHDTLSDMPADILKCVLHPKNDAVFVCLRASCSASHKLYCSDCKTKGLHKGHKSEKTEQRLARNKKSLEDLQKKITETKKITKLNTVSSQKALKDFERGSKEIVNGEKRILLYHEREWRNARFEFQLWCSRKRDELTEQHRTCSSDNAEAEEIEKEIENKLKRKAELLDIEEMLEEGDNFCKKKKRITFPKVLSAVTSEGKFKY